MALVTHNRGCDGGAADRKRLDDPAAREEEVASAARDRQRARVVDGRVGALRQERAGVLLGGDAVIERRVKVEDPVRIGRIEERADGAVLAPNDRGRRRVHARHDRLVDERNEALRRVGDERRVRRCDVPLLGLVEHNRAIARCTRRGYDPGAGTCQHQHHHRNHVHHLHLLNAASSLRNLLSIARLGGQLLQILDE